MEIRTRTTGIHGARIDGPEQNIRGMLRGDLGACWEMASPARSLLMQRLVTQTVATGPDVVDWVRSGDYTVLRPPSPERSVWTGSEVRKWSPRPMWWWLAPGRRG